MAEHIAVYDLPEAVQQRLLALASESDLLLIGETHGTQEVPRLMLGLLPALAELDYGGLALEMPVGQREHLLRWVRGEDAPPPMFGPSNFRDGRGNAQALSLVQQAVQDGWMLLCFDVDFVLESDTWSVRDHRMAENLTHQWGQLCPGKKVLGVCGNYHSRLKPPTEPTEFWPSFAAAFQTMQPNRAARSVNVTFWRGVFFNGEVRTFDNRTEYFASQAEVRPAGWAGHTLDLYLPQATPATFLDDK